MQGFNKDGQTNAIAGIRLTQAAKTLLGCDSITTPQNALSEVTQAAKLR